VALASSRQKAVKAGLPGLHLNMVASGVSILTDEKTSATDYQVMERLGFDSMTSYCWNPYILGEEMAFPETDYRKAERYVLDFWKCSSESCGIPYFPNVTMGWDPSPRAEQTDRFEFIGYPFIPLFKGNTPRAFERYLNLARRYPGHTPLAYLRICRLKEASRLLAQTDKSITEIAYEVGFQDSSHFSRLFHGMFKKSHPITGTRCAKGISC
jgi:hypothetical protein